MGGPEAVASSKTASTINDGLIFSNRRVWLLVIF
jgi:hypothetical protein